MTGHTKFDQAVPPLPREEALGVRKSLGLAPEQPLLLAGSTHEGEEEQVVDAWLAARERVPDLALMLAPRHLERVDAVQAMLEQRGLGVIRRSGVQGGRRFRVQGARFRVPTKTAFSLNRAP